MITSAAGATPSPTGLRRVFVGSHGLRAGWRILLFHLIFIALSAGAFWSVEQFAGDLRSGAFTVGKLLLLEAIYVPAALVAVAVMARIERRRFADYGIRLRALFGRNFWIGAGWGGAAVVAAALAVAAGGGLSVRGVTGGDLLLGGLLWALAALLIALYEEIFFRGYFLSALADGVGFWPAAILQSLFFGFVLHYLEKDNETLLDGFNVSLIALFFCWTVLRSGDIAWATGIHFSFNFTSFFVLGSPNTAFGGPVDPHLLDSTFAGPQWLTGGATGLEASVPTTFVFLLLFVIVGWGFRRRASGKLRGGMKLGRFDLQIATDGEFRLDGGAMFGVVPKTMWERAKAPDEKNRIRMGTNCLLIAAGSDLVLVDTGIGDKHEAKFLDLYAIDPAARRLPDSIRAAGFEPGDVTHVLLSHLHFDHCGWSTRREASGRVVPTFPRARYWMNRGEVEHARAPSERDRASYFPDNWEPLIEAGVAELFGDEAEVVPGVRAVKAPGHNADMCIVTLDGGDGARAVYWADLIPTVAHVPYPWIMGYDLYPLTTLESKKRWIPRAAAEGWLCCFEHDAETPWARLVEEKTGRFRVQPAG